MEHSRYRALLKCFNNNANFKKEKEIEFTKSFFVYSFFLPSSF